VAASKALGSRNLFKFTTHVAMLLARSFSLSALASCLTLVAAESAPLGVAVKTYNAPGRTTADTYRELRRGIAEASLAKRDGQADLKGNVSLERYWEGATLVKM
jgi:hypothetical protein